MDDTTIKNKAAQIRMLVLDVDGTLTDGGVYIDTHGMQSRKFNIKDGMGIAQLHDAGIGVGMLSHSNIERILTERAAMLGITHVYAGTEPKLHVLHRWMQELSLTEAEIAYIGDDITDLEVIRKVGLSACPADAHHQVVREVDIVLRTKGGEGCVREFIDRYLLPSGI